MKVGLNRSLIVCGATLIALIAWGQSLHDDTELRIGSDQTLAWFVAIQAVAGGIYLFAVSRVLRDRPLRRDIWLVLGIAAAMRIIPLSSEMFLSSDLFRYIWDGRVQLAGINPYRFVPIDPELADLRDTAIFSHVNRASYALTIYPPMAQVVFAVMAWIGQTPRFVRLVMVGFECLATAALIRALILRGENPARILIYAWNPLAVWEFAGNGHVDAVAIALLAIALLARTAQRPVAVGIALASAVLVKFLPAVVAPALWRRGDWRMPLAGAVTVVVLHSCYIGVGWRVFGFLSDYADEEGMADGSGIWALAGLSHVVALPAWAGHAWMGLIALGFACVSLRLILRPAADPARAAAYLMVATILAVSPHYPWYYPWLAVPAVLAPVRPAIWLSVAALLLYLSPFSERFFWPGLVFAPALVLAAIDLRRVQQPTSTLALATGK